MPWTLAVSAAYPPQPAAMMRSGSLVTYMDRIRPAWRIGRGQPDGEWAGEDWAEVVGVGGV